MYGPVAFRYVRDYRKANFASMKSELGRVDWEEMMGEVSVEEAWKVLKQKLALMEEKYVPLKKVVVTKGTKPIWLTHKAVRMVRQKHRIFKKYKRSDHPACMAASKAAAAEVRKAKLNFEKKLAEKIKGTTSPSLHM
jgi:hypothetical protein